MFNDGGTPAVEVGDRQGYLYGLDLANGSPAPGWGNGTGNGVGPGQGCNSSPSGGTPGMGVIGVQVPGSPPIDSTASVGPNGNLYVGGGNAAAPVDGGYYAYGPNGAELWNQVVTNPTTDTDSLGGVQASLSLAAGGTQVEAGSLGQETYALNTSNGSPAVNWPAVLGRHACSRPRPSATSTAPGPRTSSPAARRRTASRTARATPTAGTSASSTRRAGSSAPPTPTRRSTPPPPWARSSPEAPTASRPGRAASSAGPTRTRSKSSTPSATRSGATSWTAPRAAAPPWPTCRATGSWPSSRAPCPGRPAARSTPSTPATGGVIWQTNLGGAVYGSVTTADLGTGYQDVIVPTDLGPVRAGRPDR